MALSSALPSSTPSDIHILNPAQCEIQDAEGKGRGVYATHFLPPQTLLELSPVLLFSQCEYETYGKHTLLDHYAFRWRDGRMALALGLGTTALPSSPLTDPRELRWDRTGSLLNHSRTPNVNYELDKKRGAIRYTTARAVQPGEELCIFYGDKLWFEDAEGAVVPDQPEEETEDEWGELLKVASVIEEEEEEAWMQLSKKFIGGNQDEIVPEDELPFTSVKTTPEEIEEETADAVRTVEATVIDIVNPKDTASILKYIQHTTPDPSLTHLRRIRRLPSSNTSNLLLTLSPPSSAPAVALVAFLRETYGLGEAYSVQVPAYAAQTQSSLALKNALWPTAYAPRRAGVVSGWTRGKVAWACEATKALAAHAREAQVAGDIPVAAYIPIPYADDEEKGQLDGTFAAHDTRTSAHHPLRHAVLNAVRMLADHRAASSTPAPPMVQEDADGPTARNGTNYLLTGLTLFVTHEPCIMCSMALLHSRVKEVVYLVPMPGTGGCGGGEVCLPRLEGVNHRFGVIRWEEAGWRKWLEDKTGVVDGSLDA